MDYYEAWFDIRDSRKDLEFAGDLARYMGYLKDEGLIEGYRFSRRKLGHPFRHTLNAICKTLID